MSTQLPPVPWHRFSGRIVLSLLFTVAALSSVLSQYLGDRELLFIATVAAIYLFWIPARYLLSTAIGLLILAAFLFTPLKEDASEKLLRFVYYILILVVSRELISAMLAPFRLKSAIGATVARLEFHHYRALLWLARLSITTFRSLSSILLNFVQQIINYLFVAGKKFYGGVFWVLTFFTTTRRRMVHYFITYAVIYGGRLLSSKKHIILAMLPFFTRIAKGVEYALILLRLLLQVRIVFFVLLTAAVVLPWFLQPGYLFLLDYVWPPSLPAPQLQSGFITSLPHEWTFWLASQIIPTQTVQKVVFALPIFLAGLSASHLISWILIKENSRVRPLLISLIAGTFYALNPFVVSRVFMGQVYFLLGYALVPWAVLATLQFLNSPTMWRGLMAGLSVVGVMVSNAHHIILLPLALMPLFIGSIANHRFLARRISILIAPIALFAALFFSVRAVSNTVPSLFDLRGPWARLLQAPFSGNLWLDILALTAYWKTDLLFAFSYELLPYFSLFVIALTILMGVGIWHLWQQRTAYSWLVWQLLGIAAMSIFLAGGVSHPFSEPVAGWVYRHVPFWIGMRDSAKFIANLALVEAVLLGVGITALTQTIPAKRVVSGTLLFLMLWFVSPAYGGFNGQVLPAEYPASWQQWNNKLIECEPKPTMLVLPWHMYPAISWLEYRPIINPAAHFFTGAEVIVGDNSEVGGIGKSLFVFSESQQPFSKKIEAILTEKDGIENLGSLLAADDITYIALLADAVDAKTYQFLYTQEDLQVVFESPELVIWENTAL